MTDDDRLKDLFEAIRSFEGDYTDLTNLAETKLRLEAEIKASEDVLRARKEEHQKRLELDKRELKQVREEIEKEGHSLREIHERIAASRETARVLDAEVRAKKERHDQIEASLESLRKRFG